MKKKVVSGVIGLVILLGLAGVTFMYADKTRAMRFVERMGAGINLGNTLDSTGLREYRPDADDLEYETYWGNPKADAETFQAIKAAGFGTVRIPVTWEDHMDESYQISGVWMERVQEVVDMALAADLYVILDTHHEEWLDLQVEREDEIRTAFVTVWTQIAVRFRDYDDRLLFEGMNEPRLRDSEYEWSAGTPELQAMVDRLNETFVSTVRAAGGQNGKRYLLVAPYANRYEEEALQEMELSKDSRLIVSVHMYAPHSFCQEEDGDREWDTEHIGEQIAEAFQAMGMLFAEQNIPVILTEFGCVDKDNTQERVAWTKYYMQEAGRYGIPCIWWDCGDYALFDREEKVWKFPQIVEVLTGKRPL